MRTADAFADLIEDVYEAAIEPTRWHDVVTGIARFVGARACGLISKDSISQFGRTHYYCGVDPHYIHLYAESYSRFDPLATLPAPGQVVSIPDLVPYDDYRRGPFFQEWLRPQGCADVANVVLNKANAHSADLLTFLTGSQMLDAEMRRRIAAIAPHVRRAFLVNQKIDDRETKSVSFAETLDGLGGAVFLLDAAGRIVHANAAGHDMLRAGDVVRAANGQLIAVHGEFGQSRGKNTALGPDAAAANEDSAMPLVAPDGERYVAHVLPLASKARVAFGSSSKAISAVFVRKASIENPLGELIARTFKLTQAELRVMFSIVDVGGIAETAAALGIAESTVKTHLQRLFSKTGANRQADLVKIVAGFCSPLAH
jgi:DNA-binding CsgD family transcriptional regulator/PAS domain-containing protein